MNSRNLETTCFIALLLIAALAIPTFAAGDPTAAYLRDLYDGARFSKEAGGVISDRMTGLQWREGPDADLSWKAGQKWIAGLGNGWRTPSLAELKTLYVQDAGGGAAKNLDPIFTINGAYVWSERAVDPASMFWPQKGFSYYNYEVTGGQNGFTGSHHGDASFQGVRTLAVRAR